MMPRFVVLRHSLPTESERPTHWDWMFETNGALETWATEPLELPMDNIDELLLTRPYSVRAQRLQDHRLAYLDYEGPVSENRGSVARILQGTYSCLDQSRRQRQLAVSGWPYMIRFEILNDENIDLAHSQVYFQLTR